MGLAPNRGDPIGSETAAGPRLLSITIKDGVAMVRRFLVSAAVMALSVVTFAGCQGLRQAIRSASDDQGKTLKPTSGAGAYAVDSDPTKIQSVDSDAKNPQPFFSNNRRSGGWSSEAREIESHLGVGK
jgi:hypothetical protein